MIELIAEALFASIALPNVLKLEYIFYAKYFQMWIIIPISFL